jgi:hypothetical protein
MMPPTGKEQAPVPSPAYQREQIRQTRRASGIGSHYPRQTWSRRSGAYIPCSGRKSVGHAIRAAPPNLPKADQPPRGCNASGCSLNGIDKADTALLISLSPRWQQGTAHQLPNASTANRRDQVIRLADFCGPLQTLSLRGITFSGTFSIPATHACEQENKLINLIHQKFGRASILWLGFVPTHWVRDLRRAVADLAS